MHVNIDVYRYRYVCVYTFMYMCVRVDTNLCTWRDVCIRSTHTYMTVGIDVWSLVHVDVFICLSPFSACSEKLDS